MLIFFKCGSTFQKDSGFLCDHFRISVGRYLFVIFYIIFFTKACFMNIPIQFASYLGHSIPQSLQLQWPPHHFFFVLSLFLSLFPSIILILEATFIYIFDLFIHFCA